MTRPTRTTTHPGAATDQIAALGPFFAFTTYPATDSPTGTAPRPGAEATVGAGPRAGGWQPLDAPAVAARVTAVRRHLAAAGGQAPESVEIRVAASVAHLGLAARLLSPELALAVLHGRLLDHHLAAVRWQPLLGGPPPLALPEQALRDAGPGNGGPARAAGGAGAGEAAAAPRRDALADAFAARLAGGPLAELAALHAPFGVSPHILRGNTASAVNGSAGMIAAARPDLAAATAAFADALLDREPLRTQAHRTAAGAFRRRSCCLIYRADPDRRGALCGDCALRPGGRRP